MKGVSQVISAVLVLAVAVSIAGVYANWAPEFARNITERTTQQHQADLTCENAAVNIRSAKYYSSQNIVEVEIENTGTVNLYEGFITAALNQRAEVIGNKTIEGIEVGEKDNFQIEVTGEPSEIILNSRNCPGEDIYTTNIETS